MSEIRDHFAGKRVFVTGHTGFKGSWLSLWLAQMGAQVHGYARTPPTRPSLFDEAGIAGLLAALVVVLSRRRGRRTKRTA